MKKLKQVIEEHIKLALRTHKTKSAAARAIGVSVRTIRNYTNRWGWVKRDADIIRMKNLTAQERDYISNRRWGK